MRKHLEIEFREMLNRALILSGLWFFCALTNAQETDSIRVINLNDVSVNALSLETKSLDFPGMVTKLDSSNILIGDQTIITNSLNQIPGVFMQSGALNTNRINIRGIGSRTPFSTTKIRAYYGEIPLTDGGGETSIEDIDLRLVRNLEVQKGPNSSLYGAGLGGVILMEPVVGTGNTLSLNSSIGSFGTFKHGVFASVLANQQQVSIGYQKLTSDGYRDNNSFNRSSFFTTWRHKTEKDKIDLLVLYLKQKAFIPSSIGETDFREDPEKAAFTWSQAKGFEDYEKSLIGFSWRHQITHQLAVANAVYTVWKDNYEPRPFNILDDEQTGYGGRSRLIFESDQFSYNVGVEVFTDRYKWETYENLHESNSGNGSLQGDLLDDNRERRSYINAFLQSSFKLTPTTKIEAGVNVNSTSYEFESNGEPEIQKTFKPILSPKASIVQHLSPSTNLFVTMSHGFSPPSIDETLDSSGDFNQDIQPETGWNREIGLKGSYARFSCAISAYSMNIKNLLVTRRTADDVTFGKNVGRTQHNGLEIETEALIYSVGQNQLTAQANYNRALYEFKKFSEGGNDYSGNELTGVPKNQFNFSLNQQSKILFSGVNFQHFGEMPITDDNSIYTESYSLLNVFLGAKFNLKEKWNLRSTYRIQNLLNEKYASMINVNAQAFGGGEPRFYYPGLPRNGQFSILVGYTF